MASVKPTVPVTLSMGDPAQLLFARVREILLELLLNPMRSSEIAQALNLSKNQNKIWLQRMVDAGDLVQLKKPPGAYIVKQKCLFDPERHESGADGDLTGPDNAQPPQSCPPG
ncbi:MAG: hypothetical protein HQL73_06770 [Magnetococcales bacterium]|nr:hypothetical protein [Magnetococcales bacterium]